MRRRLSRLEIIDEIIRRLTYGMFVGDERDEASPITIEKFNIQSWQHGAKELRANLLQLSVKELLKTVRALPDYSKPGELSRLAQENAARQLSERQSKRGSKHGLQPEILAAARHYRKPGMTAATAWDALYETPFTTDDGSTVEIIGDRALQA
jgi:hypothetical protein